MLFDVSCFWKIVYCDCDVFLKKKKKKKKNFKLWRQQNDQDFGFVPLSDLLLASIQKSGSYVNDPIKAHEMVKACGTLNFL